MDEALVLGFEVRDDINESACKCRLRTEIPGDSVLAIRILKDCNRRMQPPSHDSAPNRSNRENFGGWMVRGSKLQQSDAWMSNLGASKKRRNPKCEPHKSLVQPRTPRGEIVLEA
jgi:hypothetical protein